MVEQQITGCGAHNHIRTVLLCGDAVDYPQDVKNRFGDGPSSGTKSRFEKPLIDEACCLEITSIPGRHQIRVDQQRWDHPLKTNTFSRRTTQ
jgi:hypothetical protein